jgi:hypothetical protein
LRSKTDLKGDFWGSKASGLSIDVRFGSVADIALRPRHVRYSPKADIHQRGLHVRLPREGRELCDAFLAALDSQGAVKTAGCLVARDLILGHPAEPLIATLARAAL